MLDQAGWKPGPGGVRQKDGQPLKLRIIFGPNTSKTAERVVTVAQQAWGDVGVAGRGRPAWSGAPTWRSSGASRSTGT